AIGGRADVIAHLNVINQRFVVLPRGVVAPLLPVALGKAGGGGLPVGSPGEGLQVPVALGGGALVLLPGVGAGGGGELGDIRRGGGGAGREPDGLSRGVEGIERGLIALGSGFSRFLRCFPGGGFLFGRRPFRLLRRWIRRRDGRLFISPQRGLLYGQGTA